MCQPDYFKQVVSDTTTIFRVVFVLRLIGSRVDPPTHFATPKISYLTSPLWRQWMFYMQAGNYWLVISWFGNKFFDHFSQFGTDDTWRPLMNLYLSPLWVPANSIYMQSSGKKGQKVKRKKTHATQTALSLFDTSLPLASHGCCSELIINK